MNAGARVYSVLFTLLLITMIVSISFAKIERFKPPQENNTVVEVWRISNEPAVRDWASYHSTPCFSSDGRYIAYIHYGGDPDELKLPPASEMEHNDLYHPRGTSGAREVRLYDLHQDKLTAIKIEQYADNPRWANNHNWFFYTKSVPGSDDPTAVMWLDLDTGKLERIGYADRLYYTDCDDRWIYGSNRLPDRGMSAVRIPIRPNSRAETLKGGWQSGGNLLYANPKHPVIVSRDNSYKQHYYATESWQERGYLGTFNIPFVSRHFFTADLDGGNRSVPFPEMDGAHFAWDGGGNWFLCGNGQFRGFRWDKPLPSNLELLGAMVSTSDPSPCGKSGRWISGSSAHQLTLLDLRSGDGWHYLNASSQIHDSGTFSYCYGSGLSDNDAKGSPDATKMCFVTNYNLKEGPMTEITGHVSGVSGDEIPVKSTAGFPKKGRLTVRNEVIAYKSKTATKFVGLTRRLYDTHPVVLEFLSPEVRKRYEARPADLNEGMVVTSFDIRLLPEKEWKNLPITKKVLASYDVDYTPLLHQTQTDVYTAVLRLPDRPVLRLIDNQLELVPGENHWETRGYNLYRNGKKITQNLLEPGASFNISDAGKYTATAVEWAGLESAQSGSVDLKAAQQLRILTDSPADFSWTHDRWLIDDKPVSEDEALAARNSVKEIVHLYDGVIHREWYLWGKIAKAVDLNQDGKATRILIYQDGLLARREYHHRDGWHVSTEYFDNDGNLTESIQNSLRGGKGVENRHWWYNANGEPVKGVRGNDTYVRDGSRWIKKVIK